VNATSVLLEPLPVADAEALAGSLLHGVEVDEPTRERILATAEGNPLFLEEMSALAREARGAVDVPPSIHALLQARLDTLNASERTVIERGAVEGKVFHRTAVTALAPELLRDGVPGHLVALVRKELVRPDRSLLPEDDAFRFRHLLIRDTAYEALPKAVRAELHERFADWLDGHAALLEQDEIVGYHLEQAARYRLELDPGDQRSADIGERAAQRLGAAGRRAFARDDVHATRNLLRRTAALLPEGPVRRSFLGDLAQAAIDAADRESTVELLAELERGDDANRAMAAALWTAISPPRGSESEFDEALAAIDAAQATLSRAGDTMGVARCQEARAWLCWGRVRRCSLTAWVDELRTLRQAGIVTRQRTVISWIVTAAFQFGLPVDEIRALLDDLEEDASDFGPLLAATLQGARARIEYGAGSIDIDQLREATRDEIDLAEESGIPRSRSTTAFHLETVVPWLDRDPAGMERGRRRMVEIEETLGTNLYLANTLGEWAIALTEIGDPAAALDAISRGRAVMEAGDIADEIVLDTAEAYARATQGATDEALGLISRARDNVAQTDATKERNSIDYIESRIRVLNGDVDAARTLLESLVERAEASGFHRYAERYRSDLAALG
jgi:hypothetical protein